MTNCQAYDTVLIKSGILGTAATSGRFLASCHQAADWTPSSRWQCFMPGSQWQVVGEVWLTPNIEAVAQEFVDESWDVWEYVDTDLDFMALFSEWVSEWDFHVCYLC